MSEIYYYLLTDCIDSKKTEEVLIYVNYITSYKYSYTGCFFSFVEIKNFTFPQFLTDFDILRRFGIPEVGAASFFWVNCDILIGVEMPMKIPRCYISEEWWARTVARSG